MLCLLNKCCLPEMHSVFDTSQLCDKMKLWLQVEASFCKSPAQNKYRKRSYTCLPNVVIIREIKICGVSKTTM